MPPRPRSRGVAGVGERGVGDLDLEVLFHPVTLERGPDRQPDLGGPEQRPAVDAVRDLSEIDLGRVQQL
jgi:hypothetical protein